MQYAVSSVQCDVPVRALSMHQYKYTQHLQTRENFLSNLKVKRQNGRHAKTSNNRSCTCTPVHVQVYTYMHPYLSGETLASNLNGKRQNGRHAKTSMAKGKMAAMLKPPTIRHARTYLHVRDHREKRRTWSSRETTYVITARNDVRDHREKRRTWSSRETTYVIIARDDVRDHRERQRTWSPRETTNVIIVFLEYESVSWSENSERRRFLTVSGRFPSQFKDSPQWSELGVRFSDQFSVHTGQLVWRGKT